VVRVLEQLQQSLEVSRRDMSATPSQAGIRG
jgi:hypothetical protein